MKNKTKIAVIGGSGKAGKYLVNELLHQGFQIKVLLRNPDNFPLENPLMEVVKGDVTDYGSIDFLLKDCQAVVSTLGMGIPASSPDIFSQSTSHIIRAMDTYAIRRYVVITGLNVDTPFDRKSPKTIFGTDWMKKNYPLSTANKQLEYEILENSNIDWTLVRLPMIELTDEKPDIITRLEDCLGDKISASSLACFLVEQLFSDKFVRKAPFIANV